MFMRLTKGSLAGLVLTGLLAMMPAAAFAHGYGYYDYPGYGYYPSYYGYGWGGYYRPRYYGGWHGHGWGGGHGWHGGGWHGHH